MAVAKIAEIRNITDHIKEITATIKNHRLYTSVDHLPPLPLSLLPPAEVQNPDMAVTHLAICNKIATVKEMIQSIKNHERFSIFMDLTIDRSESDTKDALDSMLADHIIDNHPMRITEVFDNLHAVVDDTAGVILDGAPRRWC